MFTSEANFLLHGERIILRSLIIVSIPGLISENSILLSQFFYVSEGV